MQNVHHITTDVDTAFYHTLFSTSWNVYLEHG